MPIPPQHGHAWCAVPVARDLARCWRWSWWQGPHLHSTAPPAGQGCQALQLLATPMHHAHAFTALEHLGRWPGGPGAVGAGVDLVGWRWNHWQRLCTTPTPSPHGHAWGARLVARPMHHGNARRWPAGQALARMAHLHTWGTAGQALATGKPSPHGHTLCAGLKLARTGNPAPCAVLLALESLATVTPGALLSLTWCAGMVARR